MQRFAVLDVQPVELRDGLEFHHLGAVPRSRRGRRARGRRPLGLDSRLCRPRWLCCPCLQPCSRPPRRPRPTGSCSASPSSPRRRRATPRPARRSSTRASTSAPTTGPSSPVRAQQPASPPRQGTSSTRCVPLLLRSPATTPPHRDLESASCGLRAAQGPRADIVRAPSCAQGPLEEPPSSNKVDYAILALVFVLAAIVRFWHIDFPAQVVCVPFLCVSSEVDEEKC